LLLLCVCSVCALQADSVRGHSTHLSPWQVSVLLDKSLRPKITEENWWSIRYYSIFALINLRNMVLLWMDKWPIQFNQQVPPPPDRPPAASSAVRAHRSTSSCVDRAPSSPRKAVGSAGGPRAANNLLAPRTRRGRCAEGAANNPLLVENGEARGAQELLIYEQVFQANHFSPRQFKTLMEVARPSLCMIGTCLLARRPRAALKVDKREWIVAGACHLTSVPVAVITRTLLSTKRMSLSSPLQGASLLHAKEGELLVRPGARVSHLLVIISGSCEVSIEGEVKQQPPTPLPRKREGSRLRCAPRIAR
jgi:hypothetical protein